MMMAMTSSPMGPPMGLMTWETASTPPPRAAPLGHLAWRAVRDRCRR